MADEHSTLEVAPNQDKELVPEAIDYSASAPERDRFSEAPELDKKSWPLSVSRAPNAPLSVMNGSD